MHPVDKSLPFWQNIDRFEMEYDEDAVERAALKWAGEKTKTTTSAMDIHGKTSKKLPKLIQVSKAKKIKMEDEQSMEIEVEDSDDDKICLTDVNQFHVKRPENETSEERSERKKAIKAARRCRKQEKKMLANSFKMLKNKH